MSDFNTKVGSGRQGYVVGEYGLGKRNERGKTLTQFCKETHFAIMNTFLNFRLAVYIRGDLQVTT